MFCLRASTQPSCLIRRRRPWWLNSRRSSTRQRKSLGLTGGRVLRSHSRQLRLRSLRKVASEGKFATS